MKITDYHFGSLAIDGTSYDKDVIVLPPRVCSPWWREQGHRLSVADLGEVVAYAPRTLVVGTGAYGAMKVPDETCAAMNEHSIRVEIYTTQVACDRFNTLLDDGLRVAAALHLTC
jgi:hypothetical protein